MRLRGAADLVGKRLGRDGQRLGIGHFEDGGDAAHDRGAAAGFEVFLVLGAGLAEMHLGVDDAGQDVKARCNRSSRPPGEVGETADPGNAAVADRHIADAHAIMVDDGSAFQNEIGRECHGASLIVPRPHT